MEYPTRLRFTSPHRNYQAFFVSPTTREIEGQLVRIDGKQLEFRDGACICTDPETIKLAIESGYYGRDYVAPEWEQMKMSAKSAVVNASDVDTDAAPAEKKTSRGRWSKK